MFRKISPLLFLQMVCFVAPAQDENPDTTTKGTPPPSTLSDVISPTNLPDNWYAWNLLRKNENYENNAKISRPTNWLHNSTTPDANKVVFGSASASIAFFKPTANADGSKNYQNYMYSNLKLDFTPLTLGGLYVESGAVGTTSSVSGTGTVNESIFSITWDATSEPRYLNILSKGDQDSLMSSNPLTAGGDMSFESIAVQFDINENFSLGSASCYFTAINIYSDWDLNIAQGKTLSLYGEMIGGEGRTITLGKGGIFRLNATNPNLNANWVLKDNSTLLFDSKASGLISTNLLGNGSITIESTGGTLILAGSNNIKIANDIHIEKGMGFTTHEQVRNEYSKALVVWVNMTGNISGEGDWIRASDGGKNATNETWLFTGDNSGFYGNWITSADVNYKNGDKLYSYLPMIFGNGSAFEWDGQDENAFYKIAGHGAIIGGTGQIDRKGMGIGFNYDSDIILFNNVQGNAKLKHLSDKVLELRGINTHVYGTYAEAGGTIRFSQALNLGSLEDQVLLSDGKTMGSTGSIIALNNNSTISFSGAGTESLKNALFNTVGSWNIAVEQKNAVLKWDMSHQGYYDLGSTSGAEDGKRTGAFTKKGAGTLEITAGNLLTSTNSIFVQQGTLAFSGESTWGKVNKIILGNETTLRNDREIIIESGMTLTTDKTSQVPSTSTIDGNFKLNGGGIIEFVMGAEPGAIGANPLFNIFNITGNFTLGATAQNQGVFQFTFLNGLYVSQQGFYLLLTADNDFRNIDLSKIKITGLTETNSRQKYMLYASGTTGWKDKFGNIHAEGYGNADGKELYLYASPDVAKLTWNKSTGGNWDLVGDESNKDSWTGHATDSRFYNNDMVVFGDNAGDVSGEIKTINIVSDVSPAQFTVKGSGHYAFSSDNGSKIVGQGDLVKEGSGTLDIYTSNTYSSGTRILGGTVNAYGTNSFGSGKINVSNNATLNVLGTEALGFADITVTGGTLNIYSTNSATRNAILNGGFIYAYGTNSLGGGTLLVQNGTVYARGTNAIGGNVIINGEGSHLYTESKNSLGNTTVTVSNGGTIHSALNPGEHGWTMGEGSTIILSNGGIFEVNSNTAVNTLSKIKFDGGEMRVVNREVDATGFEGLVELVNAKQAILNVIGEKSLLKLSGQLGTLVNADILKIGTGELIGVLSGDFRARMEILEGKGHLVQGFKSGSTTEYTNYLFNGQLAGEGIMEFSGGSINVTADMTQFSGTLYINLDNKDLSVGMLGGNSRTNKDLYDVTVNNGSISISDSSSSNILFWGNLASGTDPHASQSSIGFSKTQDSTVVRSGATISITQTRDDEFKGTFVNGGTLGNLTTSVNKEGSATLTLSNDSTTLGTLTINDGTIRLGNGGTTGFWTGKIVNNSALEMDYGNVTKTYSQEISGTGTMKVGTGTVGNVVFTANNTYTGGTVISNGNVQLKDQGTLGNGEITMSGHSTLDVSNRNGVENRTIRVSSGSSATIKTASLGDTGILTSAEKDGDQSTISVKGGSLDNVTLVTTDGKATLSGIVTGTSITLDAGGTARALQTTPNLSNINLGLGSFATATNGTSNVIDGLALSYGANSISGTAGNMEINDAKLALGTNGSYNISGITHIGLTIDQSAITSLGDDQKLTIHLFGKGADLTKVFAGNDTSKLSNIVLDSFLQEQGWSVSNESMAGDTAWWNNGDIVLVKGQSVPEPTSSALLLASALVMNFRRKRRA